MPIVQRPISLDCNCRVVYMGMNKAMTVTLHGYITKELNNLYTV